MSSFRSNRIHRRGNGDKTRRARWLDAVVASGVSRGAVAWAALLAKRSNASGKPVYGRQTGQAEAIACSDRQVRRYRRELEAAGLIETMRYPFERREDGSIGRMFTNRYFLIVAPLRRKSRSSRPDADVRENPSIPNGIVIKPSQRQIIILDEGFESSDLDPDGPFALPDRPAPKVEHSRSRWDPTLRLALARA